MSEIKLKEIIERRYLVTIENREGSSLITHKWSEKSKRELREKTQGRKTKSREARNPEQECKDATYFTEDGEYAIPAVAVKSSMIRAAHKDLGIDKTLVRKAIFIIPVPGAPGSGDVIPLIVNENPTMREDTVRVGMGGTDLRYRPEFHTWKARFTVILDAELMRKEDFANLLNRAGFGTGIGEWRPEKEGDHGRFVVVDIQEQKPIIPDK